MLFPLSSPSLPAMSPPAGSESCGSWPCSPSSSSACKRCTVRISLHWKKQSMASIVKSNKLKQYLPDLLLERPRTRSPIGPQMNLVRRQTSAYSSECFLLTAVYSQSRRTTSGDSFKSSFNKFCQKQRLMQRKKSFHGTMLHCKNRWMKHNACKQRMMMENKARSHKTQSLPVGTSQAEMVMTMETTSRALLYDQIRSIYINV